MKWNSVPALVPFLTSLAERPMGEMGKREPKREPRERQTEGGRQTEARQTEGETD